MAALFGQVLYAATEVAVSTTVACVPLPGCPNTFGTDE